MWYKIIILYDTKLDILERYVYCNSKYDLYAVIGYIYSTSLISIRRIDYKTVKEVDVEDNKIFSLRGKI